MKRILTYLLLTALLVLGGCSESSGGSAKEEYPTKTIEVIVPYAPGGSTDVATRILVEAAKEYLPNNKPIVVVNKAGGASTIGIGEVVDAKSDGYKIGVVTTTGTSIQPHFEDVSYSHDSFQSVLRFISAPQILVVKSDAPWDSLDEWVKFAEENPNDFNYGTSGSGGTAHIAMEALSSEAGIETENVPFDGAAPAITALLGGHVQGAAVQFQEAKAQIDAGAIRPLVNLGSKNIKGYEDITLANEKWPEVTLDVYTGLIAPKDISEEVLTALHNAFEKALKKQDVIEQFEKLNVETSYANSEDFQKDITETYNLTGKILKEVGLIE